MYVDYLNEAFKRLDLLNEDLFSPDSDGIESLSNTLNSEENTTVRVIDPDATNEDQLSNSYVGKILIDCHVCHAHIFKNKEDITIDNDGIVNVEEECPYCGEQEGFVIVGEITAYPTNTETEPVADTNPTEPTEEPAIVDESFNVKKGDGIDAIVFFAKIIYDNLVKNGVKCDVSLDNGFKVKVACDNFDGVDELVRNTKELLDNNLEPDVEDHGEFRYYMLKKATTVTQESLTEAVNNVNVETDDSIVNVSTEEDGKVTVTTEPKVTEPTEVITPVSDETMNDIVNNSEESPVEDETIDFDFDEVDEESLDDLGESYLKRVYENVDSFKTSNVHVGERKMVVEGLITFKSGVQKKTGFIFEAKDASSNGKVRFLGENKHLCRGRRSFTLTASLNEKKLIAESFSYNYRAKDSEGKVQRVHGTIRCDR